MSAVKRPVSAVAKLYDLLKAEHSKHQCDRIVKYIGKDKDRFAALIQLFFKGEYRITQRAAWPLSYCVRQYPELIVPYFAPLLKNLSKPGIHAAISRNTLRLLQDVTIPKKYHGRLMSLCFEFIRSPETPIAVKAFSLTVLQQLSRQYPDILDELRLIIEAQWEQAAPAFRSRAKKIIKNLR